MADDDAARRESWQRSEFRLRVNPAANELLPEPVDRMADCGIELLQCCRGMESLISLQHADPELFIDSAGWQST